MRRPASAHIVLGVHLEEAERLRGGDNIAEVSRLEADPGAAGSFAVAADIRGIHPARLAARTACARAGFRFFRHDLIGSIEPVPLGVLSSRRCLSARISRRCLDNRLGGGTGAGGAGAGGAVIVALERDTEAFVHGGLRRLRSRDCRRSDHGQRGGERTGDRGSGERRFLISWDVLLSDL